MPKKKMSSDDRACLAFTGIVVAVAAYYIAVDSFNQITNPRSTPTYFGYYGGQPLSVNVQTSPGDAADCCFDAAVAVCCGLLCIGASCHEDSHTD